MGMQNATKTVLGHAAQKTNDLIVAALAVVNPFGDLKDPDSGQIIAGAKNKAGQFIDTEKTIINNSDIDLNFSRQNTTLIVLATNAILNKAKANRVSMMAHSGLSRCIYPVHTLLDGDSIFTLAANEVKADINQIGVLAAKVVEKAILSSALMNF